MSLRNLRLALRLALAFGALGVGLLLVGGVALQQLGALEERTTTLSDRDIVASDLAGALGERAAAIGHHVAQHLYVFDGDVKAQDAVQKLAEERAAANGRDEKALTALVAGTPAESATKDFAAKRAEFVESWKKALALSREETVNGVEERDGSRTLYLEQVEPQSDALGDAADAMTAAITTGAR